MKGSDINEFKRVNSELAINTSSIASSSIMDEGEFLARLWACFGEPELFDKGFGYTIQHVPSQLIFTAYSASTGPSYGAFIEEREKVLPIITQFENLLAEITPVECEFKYESDEFEQITIGFKDGSPYYLSTEEDLE